ncbi:MAG: hypothetical protein JXA14_17565 [Anaerolineae bacterium]|nr:hypothetical protein [Anaerolineae bacterium]
MTRLNMRLHDERDRDIVAWLDAQEDKTAAIKAAIRAAMSNGHSQEPTAVDLGAIRAVLEAVLDERLSGLALEADRPPRKGEDSDVAAKLDAMF